MAFDFDEDIYRRLMWLFAGARYNQVNEKCWCQAKKAKVPQAQSRIIEEIPVQNKHVMLFDGMSLNK